MIKQEQKTHEFKGVAEKARHMINSVVGLAVRIRRGNFYAHFDLPKIEVLWAEAMHWACDALSRTVTALNRQQDQVKGALSCGNDEIPATTKTAPRQLGRIICRDHSRSIEQEAEAEHRLEHLGNTLAV